MRRIIKGIAWLLNAFLQRHTHKNPTTSLIRRGWEMEKTQSSFFHPSSRALGGIIVIPFWLPKPSYVFLSSTRWQGSRVDRLGDFFKSLKNLNKLRVLIQHWVNIGDPTVRCKIPPEGNINARHNGFPSTEVSGRCQVPFLRRTSPRSWQPLVSSRESELPGTPIS